MRVGRVSWLIKGKNYGGKMESQKILGVKKKKERPYIIRKLREDEQNDPIKRNKTRIIIIHLGG